VNYPPHDTGEQRVRTALDALVAGDAVVVADSADRENEGDLIFAAEFASPELVAFMIRHTSGFICVALPNETCERNGLVPMTRMNQDQYGTAYQVTVDLRGTGTGISAASRAATIAALGSDIADPTRFTRPGHVVPLRARPGGVLERPGHTEAAVDLARLAGLNPAGALCEIVSVDQPLHMASGDELTPFAREHRLVHLSIDDIIDYRLRHECQVTRVVEVPVPTSFGTVNAVGYRELLTGSEHLALVTGTVDSHTPVHVHIECLSGDIFGTTSCDCRGMLDAALTEFGKAGQGIVVYVRPKGTPRACGLLKEEDRSLQPDPQIVAKNILSNLGVNKTARDEPARGLLDA
jgi:3,4-dihydroxy 2-butanone 4-phosphate synthase/GTP cyclohydrolase II